MSTPTNTWPRGPCVVCGKDGEQEPRFLYFVCKEHESAAPVTCVKPQRCMEVLRGGTAGIEPVYRQTYTRRSFKETP